MYVCGRGKGNVGVADSGKEKYRSLRGLASIPSWPGTYFRGDSAHALPEYG